MIYLTSHLLPLSSLISILPSTHSTPTNWTFSSHMLFHLKIFKLPVPFVWKSLPSDSQMAVTFFMILLNGTYPDHPIWNEKLLNSLHSWFSLPILFSFSTELISSCIYILILFIQINFLEKNCTYLDFLEKNCTYYLYTYTRMWLLNIRACCPLCSVSYFKYLV